MFVIYDRRNNGFVKNLQGRRGFAVCFKLNNAITYPTQDEAQEDINKIQKKWHRQLSIKLLNEFKQERVKP